MWSLQSVIYDNF